MPPVKSLPDPLQTSVSEVRVLKGPCTAGICGPEAACVNQPDDTHTCICPHYSTPPNKDLKCPRNIVPLSPRKIPNIIPPTNITSNVTTTPPMLPAITSSLMNSTTVSVGVATLVGMFLFVIFTFLCIRRHHISICMAFKDKKRKPQQSVTPVSLSKGLLDADRYTTNPQYFAAAPDIGPPPLSVPTIPREQITFMQVIGEGCFGKVFKGEMRNEFGEVETVAIKVLKESANKEAEEDFMREVEIMSSFQHSNILSLLGVALKEPGKSPWMVFEFMHHGDLTEVLRSNSRFFRKPDSIVPTLTKESLLSIAFQIACGMEYLAGQHFVHRDLACRNCLVGHNLIVKIADFGMSRDVYTCDYYKIGGSRLLPVRWMSPESVTYGRFTLESDVWSYGVVLWEIYSLGKQPYFGHSNEEVVKLILQGIMLIPPEDCPPGICELMQCCWKTEPRDRSTFSEIHERLLRMTSSTNRLPRPPPFPVGLNSPQSEVDDDDYLKPMPSKPPHDYIQPLPD